MNNQATNSDGHVPVDLSVLKDLSFGPDWSSKPAQASGGHPRAYPRNSGTGERKSFGPAKARPRPFRPAGRPESGPASLSREQQQQDRRPRFKNQRPAPLFSRPEFSVNFYPEDAPFDALVQALKSSGRTYQLFEIAALILEKPERWVAHISFPETQEKQERSFYICVPDGLVFLNAAELWDHVLAKHLDPFFEKQVVEVESPKGSFPFVYRCSITQELIGPPNYHRYRELLEEHHQTRLPKMSLERITEQLEKITDLEVIQSWVQKMSQREVYVPKERKPDDLESIHTREAVRIWLEKNCKARLMKESKTVRVHGKTLQDLPAGPIRNSIEAALYFEKRFPLATANHLRMRLRKLKFSLYKKGSKGPSYVTAVKRKFRTPETVFSPSVSALIAVLERQPTMELALLVEKTLGLEVGALQPQQELSAELELKRKQVLQDLRWLVREGYVVEYSDGKLSIPPLMSARAAQEQASGQDDTELSESQQTPSSEEICETPACDVVSTESCVSSENPVKLDEQAE